MKTQIKGLFAVVLVGSAFVPAGSAFAFIGLDTELSLGDSHIYGNCTLVVTEEEEYSAFNSNCNLDQNDTTIYGHALPGYEIGYPRSDTFRETWHLLTPTTPIANAQYCARFGIWSGIDPDEVLRVEWGHYSDPTENIVTTGNETCETAEPQVKAYFQTFCFGSWVWVYSVDSLIPGVHLSYRIVSEPIFCYAVETFPDT